MVSEVIQKYIEDYKRSDACKANSVKEYETACETLTFIIGDRDIRSITRDDIRDYLVGLKRLPKHRGKKREYRGKTYEQLCAMSTAETISSTTIKKYLDRIKGLLCWAAQEELIDKSPAEGITYKKPKVKESDERKALSKDDLDRLVKNLGERYTEEKLLDKPERLWIPLIALYSGMRLNEICQLHTEDVSQEPESKIWHFSVQTEAGEDGDKELKSQAAYRQVPVHPQLIELGFIDYCRGIRASKAPRLWMNLTRTEKGYNRRFSNWFLGTKGTEGFFRKHVTEDTKKNFHSFRHCFTNELKQRMVDSRVLDEIIGHKHGSLSHDRYGKPYHLKTCMEAMEKIDYGVDLSTIRQVMENWI